MDVLPAKIYARANADQMEKRLHPYVDLTAVALEIRLRRPTSFQEKLRQLIDKMINNKGAR
jgi:hypothetical protein